MLEDVNLDRSSLVNCITDNRPVAQFFNRVTSVSAVFVHCPTNRGDHLRAAKDSKFRDTVQIGF